MAINEIESTNTGVSPIVIRPAVEEDVPLIMSFILELAEYEKLTYEVVATEESLRECLFGPNHVANAIIGYCDDEPVGYAFYFYNCSTFLAKKGLYLEDVYVRPTCRGKGLGKAMLVYLAKLAHDQGCGRMEWSCLDWNEPSINFYKSLGATPLEDWTIYRLTGKSLEDVAKLAEN